MRKRTIALIAILTALLAACTEKTDYNTLLVRADSLMNLHPDSALHMLESISTDSLSTKADRAYHALLLTQARDKNYMVQTDDSLIQVAVRYYDTHEDALLQALLLGMRLQRHEESRGSRYQLSYSEHLSKKNKKHSFAKPYLQ